MERNASSLSCRQSTLPRLQPRYQLPEGQQQPKGASPGYPIARRATTEANRSAARTKHPTKRSAEILGTHRCWTTFRYGGRMCFGSCPAGRGVNRGYRPSAGWEQYAEANRSAARTNHPTKRSADILGTHQCWTTFRFGGRMCFGGCPAGNWVNRGYRPSAGREQYPEANRSAARTKHPTKRSADILGTHRCWTTFPYGGRMCFGSCPAGRGVNRGYRPSAGWEQYAEANRSAARTNHPAKRSADILGTHRCWTTFRYGGRMCFGGCPAGNWVNRGYRPSAGDGTLRLRVSYT